MSAITLLFDPAQEPLVHEKILPLLAGSWVRRGAGKVGELLARARITLPAGVE